MSTLPHNTILREDPGAYTLQFETIDLDTFSWIRRRALTKFQGWDIRKSQIATTVPTEARETIKALTPRVVQRFPHNLLLTFTSSFYSSSSLCHHKMPPKPYPAPLVIPPLGNEHTHTIIALHGRGSNAERFGLELLTSAKLQARLPTVKFVFPTARKRRSTVLKRIPINPWFDNYSLEDPGQRTELQVDGLCETAQFLRGLISDETRVLGEGNCGYGKVVLWGLSQGCAAGIFALLGGWFDDSEVGALGAFVGMSGWLPFEQQLEEILRCDDISVLAAEGGQDIQSDTDSKTDREDTAPKSENDDEESDTCEEAFSEPDFDDDPFERSVSSPDEFDPFAKDEEEIPLLTQAVNHVREILDLPMVSTSEQALEGTHRPVSFHHLQAPIFLGHGREDPKVSVNLGRTMSHVLSNGFGMDLTWKSYEGLGHWYRVEDEIEDILCFLQDRISLPVKPVSPSCT